MKSRYVLIGALLAAVSFTAQAEVCALSTQTEITICTVREYNKAEKRINSLYKGISARLSLEERAILKKSELAWIKYKDTTCESEASEYEGGSMQPMVRNQCLTRITNARVKWLQDNY